jgi:hypothetical protein
MGPFLAAVLRFDGVLAPLRDPSYFAGTICRPNGADLDPLVLHSRITNVPIRT